MNDQQYLSPPPSSPKFAFPRKPNTSIFFPQTPLQSSSPLHIQHPSPTRAKPRRLFDDDEKENKKRKKYSKKEKVSMWSLSTMTSANFDFSRLTERQQTSFLKKKSEMGVEGDRLLLISPFLLDRMEVDAIECGKKKKKHEAKEEEQVKNEKKEKIQQKDEEMSFVPHNVNEFDVSNDHFDVSVSNDHLDVSVSNDHLDVFSNDHLDVFSNDHLDVFPSNESSQLPQLSQFSLDDFFNSNDFLVHSNKCLPIHSNPLLQQQWNEWVLLVCAFESQLIGWMKSASFVSEARDLCFPSTPCLLFYHQMVDYFQKRVQEMTMRQSVEQSLSNVALDWKDQVLTLSPASFYLFQHCPSRI